MKPENELNLFLNKFAFRREMAGYIGVEREHFLEINAEINDCLPSLCVPYAEWFLRNISDDRWTYELSACQVESRTNPQIDLSALKFELYENMNLGNATAQKMGIYLVNHEVADRFMPLDVYPDPRYLEIVKRISEEELRAACRVAGTHIHIGARDINHAIAINNLLVPHIDTLCRISDHSNGERLRLYKTMAKSWQPTTYENPEHLFEIAKTEGFIDNPRNCWKLIRVSIHGTIELRMFGATNSIDEILEWVSLVKYLIKEVM